MLKYLKKFKKTWNSKEILSCSYIGFYIADNGCVYDAGIKYTYASPQRAICDKKVYLGDGHLYLFPRAFIQKLMSFLAPRVWRISIADRIFAHLFGIYNCDSVTEEDIRCSYAIAWVYKFNCEDYKDMYQLYNSIGKDQDCKDYYYHTNRLVSMASLFDDEECFREWFFKDLLLYRSDKDIFNFDCNAPSTYRKRIFWPFIVVDTNNLAIKTYDEAARFVNKYSSTTGAINIYSSVNIIDEFNSLNNRFVFNDSTFEELPKSCINVYDLKYNYYALWMNIFNKSEKKEFFKNFFTLQAPYLSYKGYENIDAFDKYIKDLYFLYCIKRLYNDFKKKYPVKSELYNTAYLMEYLYYSIGFKEIEEDAAIELLNDLFDYDVINSLSGLFSETSCTEQLYTKSFFDDMFYKVALLIGYNFLKQDFARLESDLYKKYMQRIDGTLYLRLEEVSYTVENITASYDKGSEEGDYMCITTECAPKPIYMKGNNHYTRDYEGNYILINEFEITENGKEENQFPDGQGSRQGRTDRKGIKGSSKKHKARVASGHRCNGRAVGHPR